MEGQGLRTAGGGTSDSFQQTVVYGGANLHFRFVSSTRQFVFLDRAAVDLGDANVVLVDNATDVRKVAIVTKVKIPSKLTGPGELIEPFGRSKGILEFLRCEAKLPKASPSIEAMCRDLRAVNKRGGTQRRSS
jgi:hypothetical protein